MSIFDNYSSQPSSSNQNLNFDANAARFRTLLKLGASAVALVVFLLFFFNYIASVTRIGAGYVGRGGRAERLAARRERDSDSDGMGVL